MAVNMKDQTHTGSTKAGMAYNSKHMLQANEAPLRITASDDDQPDIADTDDHNHNDKRYDKGASFNRQL
jgi:hypothetical protein